VRRASCIYALLILYSPLFAAADEIFFKNGDRLTGQILRLEGGRLTFKSNLAGEVTVNLTDLESFKSDQPLDVRLEDGSSVRAPVRDAPRGEVTVAPDTPQARTLSVAKVKAINPKDGWSGSALAGMLVTRGNSNTDNANVEFNFEKRRVDDRLTGGATYLYGRQRDPGTGDKATTTDNWNARLKYDYFFSPRLYAYANTKVEKDNIANLDVRLTPGGGVGFQIVDRPDFKALVEGGLTYVYEKFAAPEEASTTEFRDHNEYFSGRLAYKLEKRFADRLTLFHNAEYLPSFRDIDDYLVNADGGLRVGITGRLFVEYKLTLTYDAMPAPGASNTDLRHLLSVGWQF
jgi:putative salt-induced outer membrane protein YdiY